jgi:phosphoribosylformylglycinamidine cyclo-ligase
MASSGLHSNGYSLARHVFFATAAWDVHKQVPELGRTLGEELLEPTRIYSLDCLDLLRGSDAGPRLDVHALCHVTGGGLAANLERVLPIEVDAQLDRTTWTPPAIFGLIGDLGGVAQLELERTLNLGVGMVAVVAPEAADDVLARLKARDLPSWVLGEITPGTGRAALRGSHP